MTTDLGGRRRLRTMRPPSWRGTPGHTSRLCPTPSSIISLQIERGMSAQDYTAEGQGFESCCLSQHGKGILNQTLTQNFINFTNDTHICSSPEL